MTLGLLVLLAVVGVAQLAALAARRRLIRRRTDALEAAEAETWFARLRATYPPHGIDALRFAGIPVYAAPAGTMPDDVAAYLLAGHVVGPIETKWQDGDALEDLLRAQRIMREYRFGMDIAARDRPVFTAIITAL